MILFSKRFRLNGSSQFHAFCHWKAAVVLVVCVLLTVAMSSCRERLSEKKQPPTLVKIEKPSVPHSEERPHAVLTTIAKIKQRGELRVGMEVGYAPFEMLGKGDKLEGLDVDLARLTAKSLMVNLRIVRQEWQDLIPSLLAGKPDVIMSGMTVTPKRNERVMFTIPIVETGRMFVVHTSNADRFRKFSDLNTTGTFVVSIPGGLGNLRLAEVLPNASYREFPNRRLALKEVLQKRAHAFIDSEFSIRLAAALYSDLLVARFKPLTYEPVAWAVRPGDTHWLNWLNNFVRAVHKDGRLDEIRKKWIQDYYLDINKSPKGMQ